MERYAIVAANQAGRVYTHAAPDGQGYTLDAALALLVRDVEYTEENPDSPATADMTFCAVQIS